MVQHYSWLAINTIDTGHRIFTNNVIECKYYSNFFKIVHCWPNNIGMFKTLYNASIIILNYKATLIKEQKLDI